MQMHQSVLLEESINGLAIREDGIYFDGTFGRGGHSQEILKHLGPYGKLYAVDKDLAAVAHAHELFGKDPRFHIFHGSFAEIEQFAQSAGVAGQVNGILLDLGVSSPQLDNAARGFSFMQDGPLDMRMNTSQKFSAEVFVNELSADDMAAVFREYGEERFAGRIARAIVTARMEQPIQSTLELAEIVKAANPQWEKHKHPATRVFQAIRIYVNQELDDLKMCLEQSVRILAPQGRLAVISFHSLEDRIVKQFMRHREEGDKLPKEIPLTDFALKTDFKRVGKAIKPKEEEVRNNMRSRSAVLRIGEKQA
ncbi:MAG: 16S rRNA (cytosine(1402)-N(4))-methyltransferase RsmH [Legionella sp.]|nr:16S rRNA (cytosine(1402)-N(4))-methyltransferase RsmH [Legionella sp.]